MEKLTIIEDREMLKSSAPVMIILGILAAIIGVGIFLFLIGGAIGGALLGGLGFGGISVANTGFKRLGMAKKPARTVVCADEMGVRVAKDAFTNAEIFFPWQDVQSANVVNKAFLLILKNPDEYINSLSDKKDINAAKQYMKKFKTPIFVATSTCKESAGEIAERINKMLQFSESPTL